MNHKNTKILWMRSISSKVPTDGCFADLLLSDSTLLQYYRESRTRIRKATSGFIANVVYRVTVAMERRAEQD